MGVQLVDFPEFITHPLYLRMYDTPGDPNDFKEKATLFRDCEVVFIVISGAHLPLRDAIVRQNAEAVKLLREYSTGCKYQEANSEDYRRYLHALTDEPTSSGSLIKDGESEEEEIEEEMNP